MISRSMKLMLAAAPLLLTCPVLADGAGDNSVENVRHIPPTGVSVPDTDRTELKSGIDALNAAIAQLKATNAGIVAGQPDLLPDVEIYARAASYALNYNEFFNVREIATAKALLKQGMDRAEQLKAGKPSWIRQTGPIVRGYRSKIDGSAQPYGLIVPTDYNFDTRSPHRLDIWFHGRGETLSEVNFINDSQHSMGEFAPAGAFVLRPYGRYCNPSRFAGETDTFEALEAIHKAYGVDDKRIAVRGFSLGGAACWDFTTHFAGDWAAANPGAGFSETADFLKVFQNESLHPYWFEQKLWHLYDATDYAINLFNVPTIAYSGELDSQRQAAEMMVKAATAEGIQFTHIIGPGAHHFYEKNAKQEVAQKVDAAVAAGREDAPSEIRFTTWTLKYNRMKWITLDGMTRHWTRARLNAKVSDSGLLDVKTENAERFTLNLPETLKGTHAGVPTSLVIDGQNVKTSQGKKEHGIWVAHFRKIGMSWLPSGGGALTRLAKVHNLQGPIDDAFMDKFIMVQPTGKPLNDASGTFVQKEMEHAVAQWRQQFRGDAVVKKDTEITQQDIATANLVIWGDPSSNKLLARLIGRLPLKWNATSVQIGNTVHPASTCVPIMVYPNPLNFRHYIVVNSGFTYREYDYLNNARQTPKLPDWAIVDTTTPPGSRYPGKIVDADFFGEQWEVITSPREP
jgi:Prolyl oligopeptidase family